MWFERLNGEYISMKPTCRGGLSVTVRLVHTPGVGVCGSGLDEGGTGREGMVETEERERGRTQFG